MRNQCLRLTVCLFLSILPFSSEASCFEHFEPAKTSSSLIMPLDHMTPESLYIGVLHENSRNGEKLLLVGSYFKTHHREIAEELKKRGFEKFQWAGELRVKNGQSKSVQVSAANEVAGMVKKQGLENRNRIENLENHLYEHGLFSADYLGFSYRDDPRHLTETLDLSTANNKKQTEVPTRILRALLETSSRKDKARKKEEDPENKRHAFFNQVAVIASHLSLYVFRGEISPELNVLAFKSTIEDVWSYFKMKEDVASISSQQELNPLGKRLKKDLELLWAEVKNSIQEKRTIDLDKIRDRDFSPIKMRDRLIEFSKFERPESVATPSTRFRSEMDLNPPSARAYN